jgi:N-formylglutamate amidohydrolase
MKRDSSMEQGKFLKWHGGDKGCRLLVDAVHAAAPAADAFTGVIAENASRILGAHCIVATVSRTKADLNRPRDHSNAAAIDEYRATIRRLLGDAGLLSNGELERPILHVAVHGMADSHDYDIELGTRNGATCSGDVRDLVQRTLEDWAQCLGGRRRAKVVIDQHFVGDASKGVHRYGDELSGCAGYGVNFNTIQIEFAHWLRRRHRSAVIDSLVLVGRAFETLDA